MREQAAVRVCGVETTFLLHSWASPLCRNLRTTCHHGCHKTPLTSNLLSSARSGAIGLIGGLYRLC
jgi:hypothetical protein